MSSGHFVFGTNTMTLDDPLVRRALHCSVTFGILQANGGIIVQCFSDRAGEHPEYFVIPDGVEDLDRELGKIISMYFLKRKQ